MPTLPDATPADRCRHYFQSYLPTILGQLLIPELESVNACCEIRLLGLTPDSWQLTITEGRLAAVTRSGADAGCCFTLAPETLIEVVAGRLAPQEAFFDTRIQLDGDMETGLMLATMLEPFFQRFAWEG